MIITKPLLFTTALVMSTTTDTTSISHQSYKRKNNENDISILHERKCLKIMKTENIFNTNIKHCIGNILDEVYSQNTTVIVQQLNCIAVLPHGLSKSLATKYPYSDVYSQRRRINHLNRAIVNDRATPGTIQMCHPPNNCQLPIIANLYAQFYMGRDYEQNILS